MIRLLSLVPLLLISSLLAADAQQQAADLLQDSGVRGGFVVHLGCGNGELTLALRQSAAFQVHGLEESSELVAQARERIRSVGDYGDIAVMQFSDSQLPYVDNMVNLLVADQTSGISQDEMLRVVTPGGTLMLRNADDSWQTIRKPRPGNIDDWSHYLHDPSGPPSPASRPRPSQPGGSGAPSWDLHPPS